MAINEYDISPDVNLTTAQEVDDFDAYVVDSITRKNTYRNVNTLTVKVVSPPILINSSTIPINAIGGVGSVVGSAAANMAFNLGKQIMFRGRIVGNKFLSPHQLLEDPCNTTKFTGDDEGLINIINQHTLCISKYDYNGSPLKIGDVVSVNITAGDAGPIDLQHCYFDSVEQVVRAEATAAYKEDGSCGKLSELFGAGLSVGDYAFPEKTWTLEEKSDAAEFFEKLKSSIHFSGFSDNFLWGLTANALAESSLIGNNAGDPESLIGKRQYQPIKNYCSFGYWQLNLCSANGEGNRLLSTDKAQFVIRSYNLTDWRENREGFNEETQERIFNYITREAIQFEYVAQRMMELFPPSIQNPNAVAYNSNAMTPSDAAYQICVDFERPVNKEKKGTERGKLATQLSKEYAQSQT